jgi:hypothetical protein
MHLYANQSDKDTVCMIEENEEKHKYIHLNVKEEVMFLPQTDAYKVL